jgi:hypothetical protein
MSATMIRMEENFRMVDVLNADQLEVTIENDFSEKDVVECEYNERFELFIENF